MIFNYVIPPTFINWYYSVNKSISFASVTFWKNCYRIIDLYFYSVYYNLSLTFFFFFSLTSWNNFIVILSLSTISLLHNIGKVTFFLMLKWSQFVQWDIQSQLCVHFDMFLFFLSMFLKYTRYSHCIRFPLYIVGDVPQFIQPVSFVLLL